MRHAQYRRELADTVRAATKVATNIERPDVAPALPALAVTWTGSEMSRGAAGGWVHSFDVEIRVGETGPALDELVAIVADTVAAWQPNTSHASAGPPTVNPVRVIDGEISYPAVLVSTAVTEPSTD